MATCCVVGATGYVGSYVTRELLKKGYRVRATCRDPAKAEWLKALVPDAKIELVALTLTPEGFPAEENPLNPIISGCKGVFMWWVFLLVHTVFRWFFFAKMDPHTDYS